MVTCLACTCSNLAAALSRDPCERATFSPIKWVSTVRATSADEVKKAERTGMFVTKKLAVWREKRGFSVLISEFRT